MNSRRRTTFPRLGITQAIKTEICDLRYGRVIGEGDDKSVVEDMVDGIVEVLTNAAAQADSLRRPVAGCGPMGRYS